MGRRGFDGQGCILADDMGLGKTLMSITIMWTLLQQGFLSSSASSGVSGASSVTKVIIVCPTSLVGNWDNEIRKWVGERCPTFVVKSEPKKIIKNFLMHRGKGVLIVSYETQRLYSKLFESAMSHSNVGSGSNAAHPVHSNNGCCDLLICDEAHKLKNAESGLAKSLNLLPAKKRILLSGTPMQNELTEFFNMVNFCNPGILGSNSEFKRRYERPILAAREPDASDHCVKVANELQHELSTIVNEFILKRGNILNAQHLPPKLVQFVCCRLSPLQEAMYESLLSSKEIRHIREGKQLNTLNSIRQLINICSHPKLILDTYNNKIANKEEVDDDLRRIVALIPKDIGARKGSGPQQAAPSKALVSVGAKSSLSIRSGLISAKSSGDSSGGGSYIDPELSGKMLVLYRMMQTMRLSKQGERIVVVSNYTQTLDMIESMCEQNGWPKLRLDGTISAVKRTKVVDEFNNPGSGAFAFLLSSKAGGCGINLVGGNRLVLFDPDWNPAADKQAAARIWREGQKRRCFIYRFMSTGTIEEKIIQRQLSKEGLTDIVDNKEQVNVFSTDELRMLFQLHKDTRSDTHDTLRCKRCNTVKVLDFKRDKANFHEGQVQACCQFLRSYCEYLGRHSSSHQRKEGGPGSPSKEEAMVLPFQSTIDQLIAQLQNKEFLNVPAYSRRQREVFDGIEATYREAKRLQAQKENLSNGSVASTAPPAEGEEPPQSLDRDELELVAAYESFQLPATFSIYNEFLNRWTDFVPNLTMITAPPSAAASKNNNGDVEVALEDEMVEQEGCPEDTDLNRWSHHCTVNTCDDELMQKSVGDESIVSFVYGLEVNWNLLIAREEAMREEVELRKQQQQEDIRKLNEKRRRKREGIEDDDEEGAAGGKKRKGKKKGAAAENGKKAKCKRIVESESEGSAESEEAEDSPVEDAAEEADLVADRVNGEVVELLESPPPAPPQPAAAKRSKEKKAITESANGRESKNGAKDKNRARKGAEEVISPITSRVAKPAVRRRMVVADDDEDINNSSSDDEKKGKASSAVPPQASSSVAATATQSRLQGAGRVMSFEGFLSNSEASTDEKPAARQVKPAPATTVAAATTSPPPAAAAAAGKKRNRRVIDDDDDDDVEEDGKPAAVNSSIVELLSQSSIPPFVESPPVAATRERNAPSSSGSSGKKKVRMADEEDIIVLATQPQSHAVSDSEWQCAICTFINSVSRKACGMCRSKK